MEFSEHGARNVRSVRNAIKKLGYSIKDVEKPSDISAADKLIFPGIGLIPGRVAEFDTSKGLPVPHIGWNTQEQKRSSDLLAAVAPSDRVYFVHSYRAIPTEANFDWVLATSNYGEDFISAVSKGSAMATQFHPEKSGTGDQYDVREKEGDRDVRNLGKPVDLAARYFTEGADEVAFLNITGFRDCPLEDLPMLGVSSFNQASCRKSDLAAWSGADKVSIGSDAVDAAEAYYAAGCKTCGDTAIEQISQVYGKQAVVVSIDPRRVYVADPSETGHTCVKASQPGPNGERWCWWQCTVKGGREGRDLDAIELAKAVEAMGAGEIMLNCIDNDGKGQGFDLALVDAVSKAVTIPVIASSGAGAPDHFTEVFKATGAAAALAAGIFHRKEVAIDQVKQHMAHNQVPTRL
eukprot:gene3003-3284_t